MSNIVLFPGSFDPITIGHLYIIGKLSNIFDKVIVVVANNQNKNYMFSLDKRYEFVSLSIKKLLFNNVEVIKSEGLIVDIYHEYNANSIARGIRNYNDFEYEEQLSLINNSLSIKKYNKECNTIFINAKSELRFISSSFVRSLLKIDSDVSDYVSSSIHNLIK